MYITQETLLSRNFDKSVLKTLRVVSGFVDNFSRICVVSAAAHHRISRTG